MDILKKYKWTLDKRCCACQSLLRLYSQDLKIGTFGGDAWEKGLKSPYFTCVVCQSDNKMNFSEISIPRSMWGIAQTGDFESSDA